MILKSKNIRLTVCLLFALLILLNGCSRDGYTSGYRLENGKIVYHLTLTEDGVPSAQVTPTDADPKTFHELTHYYAKDSNNVYYEGKKLSDVDSKTFKLHSQSGFASDMNQVYYEEKVITGLNPTFFKVTRSEVYDLSYVVIDKERAFMIKYGDITEIDHPEMMEVMNEHN